MSGLSLLQIATAGVIPDLQLAFTIGGLAVFALLLYGAYKTKDISKFTGMPMVVITLLATFLLVGGTYIDFASMFSFAAPVIGLITEAAIKIFLFPFLIAGVLSVGFVYVGDAVKTLMAK